MTATRERIERLNGEINTFLAMESAFGNDHINRERVKELVIDCQQAIRALTALCEEMEREKWLPIETAPKDVGILVYDPTVENPIASGVVHSRDGYIEAYSMPCGICCNRATHWQPLPQPPAT